MERVRNSWIALHPSTSEIEYKSKAVAWQADAEDNVRAPHLMGAGVLRGGGPYSELGLECVISFTY